VLVLFKKPDALCRAQRLCHMLGRVPRSLMREFDLATDHRVCGL
jgi:hypothetical protein